MRVTGVTKKIDDLGRVVIPKEYREALQIKNNDMLELIFVEDGVLLKKAEHKCSFCGAPTELKMFNGKLICMDCISALKEEY